MADRNAFWDEAANRLIEATKSKLAERGEEQTPSAIAENMEEQANLLFPDCERTRYSVINTARQQLR